MSPVKRRENLPLGCGITNKVKQNRRLFDDATVGDLLSQQMKETKVHCG
jgi:hypothetical protein